ncbi:PLP-dependent transferase, partial [Aureobasidium melanogenum]
MSEATLSDRGRAMAQTSLKARLQPLLSNIYHPKDNSKGIVDMGTAENHVMTKDVSSFANTKIRTSPHDFTYGEGPWGSKRLRTAMAIHMNKYFHPFAAIHPDDLVFANGITSLCELFGYAIGSPNDGILISRPSYQAFPADFGAKAGLKCVFVSFGNVDQFSPAAIENYESTLLEARDQGISIKALLLCNPHNPLGRCYPLETIKAVMQLCKKYSLHLFADEVNFRPFLDMTDHKDEWAAEDALVAKMEDNEVYITKGSLLQAEQAGWFRIIFTQEDDVMQEGFKRLFHAIGAKKVEV